MTPLYYALIFYLLAPHVGWGGFLWFAIVAGLVVLLWLGKLRAFAVFCAWTALAIAGLVGAFMLHSLGAERIAMNRVEADANYRRGKAEQAERDKQTRLQFEENYRRDKAERNKQSRLPVDPSGARVELVPTQAVVSPETVREIEQGTREMKERLGRALDEAQAERRKHMTPSELAAAEAHDREMAALSAEEFDALGREPAEPPAGAAPEPREPQRAPQREPPVPRRPQPPLSTSI